MYESQMETCFRYCSMLDPRGFQPLNPGTMVICLIGEGEQRQRLAIGGRGGNGWCYNTFHFYEICLQFLNSISDHFKEYRRTFQKMESQSKNGKGREWMCIGGNGCVLIHLDNNQTTQNITSLTRLSNNFHQYDESQLNLQVQTLV